MGVDIAVQMKWESDETVKKEGKHERGRCGLEALKETVRACLTYSASQKLIEAMLVKQNEGCCPRSVPSRLRILVVCIRVVSVDRRSRVWISRVPRIRNPAAHKIFRRLRHKRGSSIVRIVVQLLQPDVYY